MNPLHQPFLTVKNLSKQFDTLSVLNDISCTFHGGVTIVRGANGAGKSTLLRMLAGITTATFGTIETSHDATVGYFTNDTGLYGRLSVYENLKLYQGINDPLATEHSLESIFECWNIGSLKDKTFQSLSAGQKAKVNIARVFIGQPDILIFDEPTAFIDDDFAALFVEALRRVNTAHIVIIASHDLDRLSQISARTVILQEGGIILE